PTITTSALSLHDALPIFRPRAQVERGRRCRRAHDEVARPERLLEIARDEAPHPLRLQVVGVVVAVRQDVGADQDAALHLGPEALDRKSTRLNSSHDQISY